jgi:spore coat polysaccharide biosynthesis protein SpsF
VVVLTTSSAADDAVAGHCQATGREFERGSEEDVLDRYYQAAVRRRADPVLRITADCPLIDPEIIDRAMDVYLEREVDYVSYEWPEATFPRGLDVEVVRFSALENAWREGREQPDREHVTRFIYRNPDRFVLSGFEHAENLSHWRWTVDAPVDLAFARAVYAHFGHDRFGWGDVLALLAARPNIAALNAEVKQKTTGSFHGC